MKTLRILPLTETNWALVENGAVIQAGCGDAFPPHDECEVIAPAAMVFLTRTSLPKVGAKRFFEIAAFAVEDAVITEPERNHVAAGPVFEDGKTALAVIDREWMENLLSGLGKAGAKPARMPIESLLPKLQPDSWALVLNESGGFLKTGEFSACALDLSDSGPPLALTLALAGHRPKRIVVHAADFPDLESWGDLGVSFVQGEAWDWRSAEAGKSLDLLQGGFSVKSEAIEWRAFRPAFAMLLLMLLFQFSGIVFDWMTLAHEKKTLLAGMDRLFRTTFPETTVVVDAPLQMERKLAEIRRSSGSQQPGDFLPRLDSVFPELSALPPGSLFGIDYSADGIDFEIDFPGDEALQDFRKRLESRGIKAELKKKETRGGVIAAFIHIAPGAA